MPVIDSIIVSVLPEDGNAIGTGRNDIFELRFFGVSDRGVEKLRFRVFAHVVVAATAFCTGTGCTQQ